MSINAMEIHNHSGQGNSQIRHCFVPEQQLWASYHPRTSQALDEILLETHETLPSSPMGVKPSLDQAKSLQYASEWGLRIISLTRTNWET